MEASWAGRRRASQHRCQAWVQHPCQAWAQHQHQCQAWVQHRCRARVDRRRAWVAARVVVTLEARADRCQAWAQQRCEAWSDRRRAWDCQLHRHCGRLSSRGRGRSRNPGRSSRSSRRQTGSLRSGSLRSGTRGWHRSCGRPTIRSSRRTIRSNAQIRGASAPMGGLRMRPHHRPFTRPHLRRHLPTGIGATRARHHRRFFLHPLHLHHPRRLRHFLFRPRHRRCLPRALRHLLIRPLLRLRLLGFHTNPSRGTRRPSTAEAARRFQRMCWQHRMSGWNRIYGFCLLSKKR